MMLRKSNWHPADIIAALRKRGTTLAAISREAGLSSSTLANALSRPWPKGEWIIANFLGIHPSEIWPSRYYDPMTGDLLERKVREKPKKIQETGELENKELEEEKNLKSVAIFDQN